VFLHCATQETPKHWSKWLALAELWYNTSYHASLQCSPFKALYGIDPAPGFVPMLKNAGNKEVSKMLKERQLFTKMVKQQLAKAQNRMKLYVDNNRTERTFQVGECVTQVSTLCSNFLGESSIPKVGTQVLWSISNCGETGLM
jgi:hypothetical protein